jgi:hypothetical protein
VSRGDTRREGSFNGAAAVFNLAVVAFVLVQESVEEFPEIIIGSDAVISQCGIGTADALTTTGTLQRADPVAFVTVRR